MNDSDIATVNVGAASLKSRILTVVPNIGALADSSRIRDRMSQVLFEIEQLPELLSFSDRCQILGTINFLSLGLCRPEIFNYVNSSREREVVTSSQEIAVEVLQELIFMISGDFTIRTQFKTTRSRQIYRLCQLHTSPLVNLSVIIGSSLYSLLQYSALQYLGIRKTGIDQLSDLIGECVMDVKSRLAEWQKAYKRFKSSRNRSNNDHNSGILDFLDIIGIPVGSNIERQKSDEMDEKDWQSKLEGEFVDSISCFFSQIDSIHGIILSAARSMEIIDIIDPCLRADLDSEEFVSPLEFLRIFREKYEKRVSAIMLPPPPMATVSQYRHDQLEKPKRKANSLQLWQSHEIDQRDIARDCVYVNGESCVETSNQRLSMPNKKKILVSEPQSVISLLRWHVVSRIANIMASTTCHRLISFMSSPQAVDLLMDRVLIAASRTVASGDALIVLNKLFGGDGLSLMPARRYQSFVSKQTKTLVTAPDCYHIWIEVRNDIIVKEPQSPKSPVASSKQDDGGKPLSPSPSRRGRSRSLGEDDVNAKDNTVYPKPLELDIHVPPTTPIDDSFIHFDHRSHSTDIPSDILQSLLTALNDDDNDSQNVEIQVSVVDYFDLVRNADLDMYSSWASSMDYCKTIQPTSTSSLLHFEDMMSSSSSFSSQTSSRSSSLESVVVDAKQLLQACPLPYLMSFKSQVVTIIPVPGIFMNCDNIETGNGGSKVGAVRRISIEPVFGM